MNPIRTTWLAALLAAIVPAQTDAAQALARARLIEQQEGDLDAAAKAYRELLDARPDAAIAAAANLHLGELLWRLDKKDEARTFLESAALDPGEVGAAAQAVLQGQDPVSKQDEQRLQEARDLVDKLYTIVWSMHNAPSEERAAGFKPAHAVLCADLLRCGDAGAKALIEELADEIHKADLTKYYQNPDALEFARLLWKFDAPSVRDYLVRVAAEGPLAWQRFLTQPVVKAPASLIPAILALANVNDPAGLVQKNLGTVLQDFETGPLLTLAASTVPAARSAAFGALAVQWPRLDNTVRLQALEALRSTLPQDLTSDWWASHLAVAMGQHGPAPARRLLLERITTLPQGVALHWQDPLPLDDEDVALILAAARRKGPTNPRDPDSVSQALGNLVCNHTAEWTARSVDAMRELVALGYARRRGDVAWLERWFSLASTAQQAKFVRALPQLAQLDPTLQMITRTPPSDELLHAVLEVTDAALTEAPEHWQMRSGTGPGYVFGRVLEAVAIHPSQTASTWLTGLLDRTPWAVNEIAAALLKQCGEQDLEPALAGLRRVLAWPAAPDGLRSELRSRVFQALVRAGDAPAIGLYAEAYSLGLVESEFRTGNTSRRGRGIAYLTAERTQDGRPMHGYDDAQLVDIWRRLLRSEAKEEVWKDVTGMRAIPAPVLPLVLAELLRRTREVAGAADFHPFMNWTWITSLENLTTAEWRDPELRKAIDDLLRSDGLGLDVPTVLRLPPEVGAQFLPQVKAVLRRSQYGASLLPAVARFGDLAVEDWLAGLGNVHTLDTPKVLALLRAPLDERVRTRVVELLRDAPSAVVRAAAAQTLARLDATEAVPALLAALWDPNEDVTKAATEALQRLRFHQEQSSWWQAARAGVDTSPAATAARLLLQAAADQPQEQRLLAIRSLGTLADPAALPHLIEWTKDADAAIAAAARASLSAIHERGVRPR